MSLRNVTGPRRLLRGTRRTRRTLTSLCRTAVTLAVVGLLLGAPTVVVGAAASVPAATQVALTGPSQVLSNVPFTIGGRGQYLFNGTWVGLNNQLVTLQTGRTSTGPWVWLAYLHTSSTGTFALTVRTTGTVFYRAVVAPTPTLARSTSTPRLVTVVGTPGPPVFDRLPAGAPPLTVAYSIGTRVFYGGREQDLASVLPKGWGPQAGTYFTRVVASHGVVITATHVGFGTVESGDAGAYGEVGLFWPSRALPGAYLRLATSDSATGSDVTTAGVVLVPPQVMPGQVRAYNLDGTRRALMPVTTCCDGEIAALGVRGYVGSQRPSPSGTGRVLLWWIGGGTQALPLNYEPVGRLGVGWLGARTGLCWRTAPANNPNALRAAQLCSMTRPLLSADGNIAVVVQAGRVRVLDARTGRGVSVAQLPAVGVTGWGYGQFAAPAAWETPDLYLVNVHDHGASALVRCSVSTGRCQRVVRTTGALQTERGYDSVVYGNTLYPSY